MYAINLHIYFKFLTLLNLIKPYGHKKISVTSLTHFHSQLFMLIYYITDGELRE